MQSTLTRSIGLALLSLAAGCQTIPTTGTTGSKPVCLIWTPAEYSASKDSQETIDGNRALNARRDAYCK